MFNSKLKQRIAELETANENLQKQYDLVHVLLQARQDDCVALQRQLASIPPSVQVVTKDNLLDIRVELLNEVSDLKNSIRGKIDSLIEEFEDSDSDFDFDFDFDFDSDEDEDEDEDD